jgi:RNA polymerase sigma factor (sigma-70 family)
MPTTRKTGSILGQTLQALFPADGGHLTDDELLTRFVATREEGAFTALVRRHGPMVLGVCRRVLGHAQDAEDAFQATFLILARKAASAVPSGAVGNWLYGVAYRTALAARSINARRRQRERPLDNVPHPETAPQELQSDVLAALDRELSRLPNKYRQVVVLCELEGRSRKEVARQLGLPEGTLSWRLAAARKMLARRLARYGPEVAGATLVAVLADGAAARLPPPLVGATVRAAAGVIPAQVAALTQEVLKAMLLTRLKKGMALVFLLGLLALTCGALAQAPADRKSDPPAGETASEGDPTGWRDDPLYRVSEALVAWWPADGHAFDLVGSFHGKMTPPVGFEKGCRGRAFSFAPAKGWTVPLAPLEPAPLEPAPLEPALAGPPTGDVALPLSELTDTFTMALWVYPTATFQADSYMPQYAGTMGQRFAVYPTYGGEEGKRAGCGISVGTNGVGLFEHTYDHGPCVLKHKTDLKGWTHVAVVYVKGTPTLYLNGTAVQTGERSQWTVFPGAGFGDPRVGYGPYQGLIDEATLFNRALKGEEIKVVMRATGPEKPAPAAAEGRLSDAAFTRLWSALGGKRSPRSLFAVDRLAAGGDETVRRLRKRLLSEPVVDRPSVEELIAQLDDDAFDKREQAAGLLKEKGNRIVPKLREALKASPSAEVRVRLEKLLQHWSEQPIAPEELQAVRAITALGRIDTPASRALLGEIARGPDTRPQTVAARGALAQADGKEKKSGK